MKKSILVMIVVMTASLFQTVQAQSGKTVNSKEVVDAYHYFLARLLILRQEHLDFKNEGFEWNKIIHRGVGKVEWANPNLDVAYSEAWLAIDDNSCTMVEIPEIKNRYYTFQTLNGWGETVSNINERTYPKHSSGKFAICTPDSKVQLPAGAEKIVLNGRKFRVLSRVELGADTEEAVGLQKQINIYATGTPKIEPAAPLALFDNKHLPHSEAFENAEAVLRSAPDVNPGMKSMQEKVIRVSSQLADPAKKAQIDKIIAEQAIPSFHKTLEKPGPSRNGWGRPNTVGNYGSDYMARTIIDFIGIWANNSKEAIYFQSRKDGSGKALNGSNVYTMTFPKTQLPESLVQYFWSVIAVDGENFRVIPNPLNKFLINKQTTLSKNKDGSLTIVFASKKPDGISEGNWLPTPAGQGYTLTFRFYGPKAPLTNGTYFPPPLMKTDDPKLSMR